MNALNVSTRAGWFVGWGLLLGGAVSLLGAEDPARLVEASGLKALKESRFGEARQAFAQGLTESESSTNAIRQAEAHFYLGLVDQQQAVSGLDEAQRIRLLESAVTHYQHALETGPEAAGILNNLARVQVLLGQTNAALSSLSRAVELNDSRRGFYAENYADLLLQAGKWRDACRYYALVAGEQPQNRAVHRKMVDACVRQGPDLLAWYLWELAQAGQVVQVLESTLSVMREPVWTRPQREELMGLVAFCLSRKNETVDEFAASSAALRLNELVDDSEVGEGAKGLLHLYQPGPLETARVRWWTRLVRRGEEARRGLWPFEAFLGLVRALGDRAGIEGNLERQEAYWMLAVGAKPGAPDPDALLLVANFYSDRKDLAKLDALLQRYEVDIFRGKGEAYSSSQTEKIYRYHMALGVIYSQLDRWKTPGQVNSALFQLRRAIETADHLNENYRGAGGGAGGGGASPVVVPTRLVDLLATGYEKTGQAEESIRVRFDQAEKYLKINQSDAAARVMAPLTTKSGELRGTSTLPAGVQDSYRTRWKSIDEKMKKPSASLESPSTGRVTVRVAPEASVVAGGETRRALTESERRNIESSVGKVVQGLQGKGAPATPAKGSVARPLSTNDVAAEVQEVTVTGNQGRVLLRQGTNLVQVPFQVDGAAGGAKKKVRFIRP